MRCWFALTVLVVAGAWAGPFDVQGVKPESAAVLEVEGGADGTEEARLHLPAMLLRQQGVRAVLNQEQVRLLGRVGTTGRVAMPAGTRAWTRLRLEAEGRTRDVTIVRDLSDRLLVPAEKDAARFAMVLHEDALAAALLAAQGFAGSLERHQDDPQPAAAGRLTGPALTPSLVTLDAPTLKARFTHGGRVLDPTTRTLADEAMVVRLPRAMDTRMARGLLVYVHPGESTAIPQAMHAVLDELGFVAIAPDNVPNQRGRVDRMQLTLDAIATACSRYVIDPDRIYVSGVSGGGKIASHTWACAPDVIDGVVAIVGVGSYENMKRDDGKYWRGDFEKPLGAQWKQLKAGRLVALTGDADPNQDYIRRALAVMKSDGLSVRLDAFEDMGHEMATAERFADALRWVDELARTRREGALAAAQETIQRLRAVDTADVESRARVRAELEQVMRDAPYSVPAWEAVELWRSLPVP